MQVKIGRGAEKEGRGEEGDETQEHKHGTALRPAMAWAARAAAKALSTKKRSPLTRRGGAWRTGKHPPSIGMKKLARRWLWLCCVAARAPL